MDSDITIDISSFYLEKEDGEETEGTCSSNNQCERNGYY